MYTQFFHLKQSPFSIAPDPRYLFMSERHREALAHLLYGVGSGGGFVLLTGEIGAGKTTVCRCFMEQIPENCQLAYIFNPKLTVEELLLSVCEEFGIAPPPRETASVKTYVDAINGYLLASHAQGKNNVLIIDEAQNLSPAVLEQLRLLTNLETSERKLLQIILIGQPELRAMLARPELEQLAQRVIARYHLGPLSVDEVGSYVRHRLAVAGASGASPFGEALMPGIHRLSKGVPRRVNLLCDRALLGAYVEGKAQVTRQILGKAAQEVFGGEGAPPVRGAWPYVAAGLLAGAVLTGAAAWQLLPAGAGKGGAANAGVSQGAVANTGAGKAAVANADAGKGAGMNAGAGSPAAPTGAAEAGRPSSPVQTEAAPAARVVAGMPPAQAGRAGVDGLAEQAGPSPAGAMAGAGATALMAGGMGANTALRQLSALWGGVLADGEGCAAAARKNLRCLQGKGGLAELRQLDRPAALRLRGEDPVTARYVLLMALDGQQATVLLGGKPQLLALPVLEAGIDGSFITLWRAHRSWREEVSAGDRGPDVDWLARRFAQMHGLKKPADNQALEGTALRLLREFQGAQGLKADGVAGPKTFIRLSLLAGVSEPRLREQARGAASAATAGGGRAQ